MELATSLKNRRRPIELMNVRLTACAEGLRLVMSRDIKCTWGHFCRWSCEVVWNHGSSLTSFLSPGSYSNTRPNEMHLLNKMTDFSVLNIAGNILDNVEHNPTKYVKRFLDIWMPKYYLYLLSAIHRVDKINIWNVTRGPQIDALSRKRFLL